jgi:hypothetical protein
MLSDGGLTAICFRVHHPHLLYKGSTPLGAFAPALTIEDFSPTYFHSDRRTKSIERRRALIEAFRVLRVVIYLVGFTTSAICLARFTSVPGWGVVIFIALFAGFMLFLDDKLASALIKWKGAHIDLKGAKPGAR